MNDFNIVRNIINKIKHPHRDMSSFHEMGQHKLVWINKKKDKNNIVLIKKINRSTVEF